MAVAADLIDVLSSQGVGVIGLAELSGLRVLNINGNPELDASEVVQALLGKTSKRVLHDGFPDSASEPLHNLEFVHFGLPKRKGVSTVYFSQTVP